MVYLSIIEAANPKLDLVKLAKAGVNKLHMCTTMPKKILEHMGIRIIAETPVANKSQSGATQLTLTHHGNSVIRLVDHNNQFKTTNSVNSKTSTT